jgi:predicted nucleotidyltransferase
VLARFDPVRAMLFGSHGRGGATDDSDIDLLVIVDDDAPPAMRTLAAAQEARRGYRGAVDVIAVGEAVYRRRRRIAGPLADEAAIDGPKVYERA